MDQSISIWLRTDHYGDIVVYIGRYALLVVYARKNFVLLGLYS